MEISSGVRLAVGSSKMMMRALLWTARAISTICRLAVPSSPTGVAGSMWKFSDCSNCCAWMLSLLKLVMQLLVAEFDVLRRRHRRHQAGFLIDHADAGCERIARRVEIDRLAVDEIIARGQLDGAGDRLAERRFAGAVLADQRVDLAGMEIEIDVLDGVHAAIDLAAVDDAQHRLAVPAERLGDVPPARRSASRSCSCLREVQQHPAAALGNDHQRPAPSRARR